MSLVQIKVLISSDLYSKIQESGLEESELVSKAITQYFNSPPSIVDIKKWQQYIESKLIDLQTQLDTHRCQAKEEATIEFDSSVTNRKVGKSHPLDISNFSVLREGVDLPSSSKKTPTTPVKQTKVIKEETIEDFQLPL